MSFLIRYRVVEKPTKSTGWHHRDPNNQKIKTTIMKVYIIKENDGIQPKKQPPIISSKSCFSFVSYLFLFWRSISKSKSNRGNN